MAGRRWTGTAAVLAVAALVAAGGWQASRAKPSPTRSASPPPHPGPIRPPADFARLPPAGPTGIRLLVAGQRVTELDLDSGVARRVTGIPGSTLGYTLRRTDGGAVIVQPLRGCPVCTGTPYLVPAGSLAATRLDGYDTVVPAAEPGMLWGYRPAGADGRAGTVRQIDYAGRPHGPAYPLPAGRRVERGTTAGLLTLPCCDATFELWDPRADRVVRPLGVVLAASATRVAWADRSCVLDCPVRLTDLATGADRVIPVHGDGLARLEIQTEDRSVVGGAFSPDGSVLAVAVPRRPTAGSTGPTQDVVLLTAAGSTPVASSTMAADVSPAMMWVGARLVLALSRAASSVEQPMLSLATATLAEPELRRIPAAGLLGYAVVGR